MQADEVVVEPNELTLYQLVTTYLVTYIEQMKHYHKVEWPEPVTDAATPETLREYRSRFETARTQDYENKLIDRELEVLQQKAHTKCMQILETIPDLNITSIEMELKLVNGATYLATVTPTHINILER